MISNVKGESYEEKLKYARLTSLKQSRRRDDRIEMFKIMKGMIPIKKIDEGECGDGRGKAGKKYKTKLR
jgi:hypothetical protein